MKKLSPEEIKGFSVVRYGRRHPVTIAIEQLAVGEGLHIPGSDWPNHKRSPQYLVNRSAKALGRKYNFFKLTDVRGWLVERVS